MTTLDYQSAARRVLEVLGEQGARQLLRLLETSDEVRADTYRQLYDRGGHDALLDALAELEADPGMRGWLAEHLQLELPDS